MSKSEIMWVLGSLNCIAMFFIGFWFSRSTRPINGMMWFGRVVDDPAEALEKKQLMGRIFMVAAPIFFVFWSLLLFGVMGPVEGLEPIKFR